MKKSFQGLFAVTILSLTVFLGWHIQPIKAHGTEINYKLTKAIEVEALFDTGEPMANAQVIVYAPDNPEKAWLQGEADAQGRFIFTPDTSIAGRWDVTIRTAGHGDVLYIPIEAGEITVNNNTTNRFQTMLMGAMGLWGFIGTALYFSRRK